MRPRRIPWQHVHFVGIGGVGMSGLASILVDMDLTVSGSDPVESDGTRRLAARGVDIAREHKAGNVPPETDLLVYSSAVSDDNPERMDAVARGLRSLRRGEFLAELARCFDTVVGVGGSHGKTTTSAMIAHILRFAGLKPGFLIGGEVPGWAAPAGFGRGEVLVTEVDESDGTQALLAGDIAVILNIEDDHCWNVGGVQALEACFAEFSRRAGRVVAWDSPSVRRVLDPGQDVLLLDESSTPPDLKLPIPGRHNRANATVAIEVAAALGIDRRSAVDAMATFAGVGRRMTVHYRSPDDKWVLIEDYAHHPTELSATLQSLRTQYPGHRLHVVFQPHRYERIKRYGHEFSALLSSVDEVTVYDTFAAWVDDAETADARSIADGISGPITRFRDGPADRLARELAEAVGPDPTVFAIVGAGDVTRVVEPLRSALVAADLECLARDIEGLPATCEVRTDIPWSGLTTLGIGCACPVLVRPADEESLTRVVKWAAGRGVPVRVVGRGSNLVGSDRPQLEVVIQLVDSVFTSVSGLAGPGPDDTRRTQESDPPTDIRPDNPEVQRIAKWPQTYSRTKFQLALSTNSRLGARLGARQSGIPAISHESNTEVRLEKTRDNDVSSLPAPRFPLLESRKCPSDVVVGSGCSLRDAFLGLGRAGLLPAECAPLAWIPGSVGGAVVMNAGAAGVQMGDWVTFVRGILPDGTWRELGGDDIGWGYRHADLPRGLIVTQVRLRTCEADAADFEDAYKKQGTWRRECQPAGRSAGSVFRNAGQSAAGQLIERAGLKGLRVGACGISRKHANFIVAGNGTREADFAQLVVAMRVRVAQASGVNLRPEVVFVNRETARRVESCIEPTIVAVLKGGPSRERKISLISGAAVANALREAGLIVHEIDVTTAELPEIPSDTHVVFPVLHGTFGEDGGLQRLLEQARWRYVGSGPEASRIAMDKTETKRILREIDVPTPKFITADTVRTPLPEGLAAPLIVKPNSQGSSVGMTKLERPDETVWRTALQDALSVDTSAMVEEFIKGTEITVGIVQGEALPVCEIVPPDGRVFDYDAKYDHKYGETQYLCPPVSVSRECQAKATEYALRFYEAIGAKDMLRVDFIVDAAGVPWCLEGNSIPGFTSSSLLPKAAAVRGIAFPELCARLVHETLGRLHNAKT